MNGWQCHFDHRDRLMRRVNVWIYRHRGDGQVEIRRPDDMVELVPEDVDPDGPPALTLRSDEFDALIDAAYDERIRRGTAPDTEAKVLREMLAKEQTRVDHALGMSA